MIHCVLADQKADGALQRGGNGVEAGEDFIGVSHFVCFVEMRKSDGGFLRKYVGVEGGMQVLKREKKVLKRCVK